VPYDTQKNEASENSDASLFADKGIRTLKRRKSFRPPFSKGGAVEAAEASSRSAEREITFAAFLFANFFFAPLVSKKKWRMKFVHCYKLYTFGLQPGSSADFGGAHFLRRVNLILRILSKMSNWL
jgi:hypothetical protein